jgi:hypothetical protein
VAAALRDRMQDANMRPPLPPPDSMVVCLGLDPRVVDFVNASAAESLMAEATVRVQRRFRAVAVERGEEDGSEVDEKSALQAWEAQHARFLPKRDSVFVIGEVVVALVDCGDGALKTGERAIVESFPNNEGVRVRKGDELVLVSRVRREFERHVVEFLPLARGRCLLLAAARREYARVRLYLGHRAPRPGELLRALTRAPDLPVVQWVNAGNNEPSLQFAGSDDEVPFVSTLLGYNWPATGRERRRPDRDGLTPSARAELDSSPPLSLPASRAVSPSPASSSSSSSSSSAAFPPAPRDPAAGARAARLDQEDENVSGEHDTGFTQDEDVEG